MRPQLQRSTIVLVVTALLLAGFVAFVLYSVYSTNLASKEAEQTTPELVALYRLGGDRPSIEQLRRELIFGVADESMIPKLPGLVEQSYGVNPPQDPDGSHTAHIVLRGESVAEGWCFTVSYEDETDAQVRHDRCSAVPSPLINNGN